MWSEPQTPARPGPTGRAPCAVGSDLRPQPALSPQDAWSDEKGQLHLDAQQDYQLLQAQRTPQGLSLLFRRPFSTCDPRDYLIEVGAGPGRVCTAASAPVCL